MTEQEYVIDSFNKHFSTFDQVNIALYGLGGHTKIILDAFPDHRIQALLDGYKSEGELYGKPIIPLEELVPLNIEVIIIVARSASMKIIYKRISNFCKRCGIRVYDFAGNELTSEIEETGRISYDYNLCENDVKQLIQKYTIISFDIFNTLLTRKAYHQQNVFQLVQKQCQYNKVDFVRERTLAEQELAENHPTLAEIYQSIVNNTCISENEAEYLMQTEISLEKDILTGRECMIELLNYAVSLGKQVYLISDMYLSKNVLTEILSNNSITGYQDILVSCEYHTGKRQNLYQVFKNLVKGEAYLHIGDDKDVDGNAAKRNGIDELIIDSPMEILEKSSYRELAFQLDSLEQNLSVGLLAEKLFNNPFCLYHSDGRPTIHSAYQLGYVFLAPVLTNYIIWLIDQLKGKGYKKVLFLARDGYLLKRLYDEAILISEGSEQLPQSLYFLSSRKAGISATAQSKENIVYASGLSFDGTPEELLKQRFFLQDDEIEPYYEYNYSTKEEYIGRHIDKIVSHAHELCKNYRNYISGLDIGNSDKIAFFDFVSTGTCHMCIEEIMNHKLDGYYFNHLAEKYHGKEKLSIVSYYANNSIYENESNVAENYFLLESVIKAINPSILHFDSKGNPVYAKESRSKEQLEFIKQIQEGIFDYFKEFLKLTKSLDLKIEKDLSDRIFGLMQGRYSDIRIMGWRDNIIRDEFCNRNISMDVLI